MSISKFVDATHQALSAAHLPAKDYAGHSFRTAAMSGLEDSTIQTLGRWKSSSYQLYITAGIYVCLLVKMGHLTYSCVFSIIDTQLWT